MPFYALTIHPQKVPVLNINYLDSNEIKIITYNSHQSQLINL